VANILLDNSTALSLRDYLKTLFVNPVYSQAMIATGYIDIPGLSLVCEEMKSFLERSGTSIKLLIGKEPIIHSYQKIASVNIIYYSQDFFDKQ
jgi:hypothetical protein